MPQLMHERRLRHFVMAVSALVTGLLLAALLLCLYSARLARAADLPGGVTCEQVVRFAADLSIPDTRWGRAQARVIALALGIRVTSAQLDEAARCLRESRR